VGRSLYIKVT